VLIQQEHRHPGSPEEFIDLGDRGALGGWGVSVVGGLSDAVGLIGQQHVQGVGFGLAEDVEVAKERLDPPFPPADDLT
jgi:hypothetical protein